MDTIKVYLDNMFNALPNNHKVREAKAELFSIMEDKYQELKAAGKSENEAVGIVINEFGNLEEVAETLGISSDLDQQTMVEIISHEEIIEGYEVHKMAGKRIGLGVLLVMIGVAIMMLVLGSQSLELFSLSEDEATYLGVTGLMIFIATAVYQFIVYGTKLDKYERYAKELVELTYDDRKYLETIKDDLQFPQVIGQSVIMFILSSVPILIANFIFGEVEGYTLFGAAITILIIGLGVYRITSVAIVNEFCEKLLQVGEYTEEKKLTKKKYDYIFSAYWMVVALIYLVISFLTHRWEITWIIWPVAGFIFGILNVLLNKD